jgi:hypothetical protein
VSCFVLWLLGVLFCLALSWQYPLVRVACDNTASTANFRTDTIDTGPGRLVEPQKLDYCLPEGQGTVAGRHKSISNQQVPVQGSVTPECIRRIDR